MVQNEGRVLDIIHTELTEIKIAITINAAQLLGLETYFSCIHFACIFNKQTSFNVTRIGFA